MSKLNKKRPTRLILYRCPWCGSLQLKDVAEVQAGNIWLCEMCGSHFAMA